MELRIGQKVAYPNHGVCLVEKVENKRFGESLMEFYSLKSLLNNSVIFVPKINTESVGIRPVINSRQCELLLSSFADDFEKISPDWKVRSKEFNEKLQSGCAFATADVFKKLSYLSRQKNLSFREQRLFEKAKSLVISELATVCSQPECQIEVKINQLLEIAFEKHSAEKVCFASNATH